VNRDFIVIVGAQGAGKTVWAKKYTAREKRLFVFDPMASYQADFNCDLGTLPEQMLSGHVSKFRVGTHYPDDLPLFGSLAYSVADCTFIVEEAALVFRRGELLQPWAKRLIFAGRHVRVNFIILAQRASSIPVDIRSQATRFVSFRQSEPDDVKACADRIGYEARDELPTLPDLTCLDYDGREVKKYSLTF
jgi:hypothetical protein